MSGQVIFLTHGDVAIDPEVPVPQWGLNADGKRRHTAFARDPMLSDVRAIYSSEERKAVEAAEPVASQLGLTVKQHAALGENDRSATGFLPPETFWPVVEEFFGDPESSTHGWERAVDAQSRIVKAVQSACEDAPFGDVLVVAHGGVGALLRCHLMGRDITMEEGQPHPKGGCHFAFDRPMSEPPTQWRAI